MHSRTMSTRLDRVQSPLRRHSGYLLALAALCAAWATPPAPAAEAAEPPILTLRCDAEPQPSHRWTLSQLRQLPRQTIQTALPASLGGLSRQTWTGVSLQTLMEQSHCHGTRIKVLALNAYADTIPQQDLSAYHPILADTRDGQDISVRDKGPLIVIYPFDEQPSLNTQVYFNRSVWQVYALEVR